MPSVFPAPAVHRLAICWTDVRDLPVQTAARWIAALPQGEQDRFAKYRHTQTAHEFLVGRLLVRTWLAALTGTPAGAWQFRDGHRGRPEIAAPPTTLQFNLAHSGGVVACVLSDRRDAGVDVEYLGRRELPPDIWHRYCAPSEIADIEMQPDHRRQRRFLTYWTLKEAYLKARGLGIAVSLADVAFTIDGPAPAVTFTASLAGTSTDWAFGLDTAGPDHLVSWATPQSPGMPRPDVTLTPIPLPLLAPGV